MQRAQRRAAVTEQRFWFRKQVYPLGLPADNQHSTPTDTPSPNSPVDADFVRHAPHLNGVTGPSPKEQSPDQSRCPSPHSPTSVEEEYEEMTINEIINGNVSGVP